MNLFREIIRTFEPPPDLLVSEWADRHRVLSPEASAEPGRWSTDRARYQAGIMDAVKDPDIETVVVMSSSQIGKTECLCNVIGYFISQDPSPILVINPTLEMAQTFSKDRLAPMTRDTEILKGIIKTPRSKDSTNTILHKVFPGGHITIAGANSPASLASRPIRIVLCDEIDRYPASAGTEGDPVSLAIKRSLTFWNKINILTSTPTIKGLSRIEAAWNVSDQRRFFIPCPHCNTFQILEWHHVVWTNHDPETAMYKCIKCEQLWTDAKRWSAIREGEWRPTAESTLKNIAGFHIWEAYSPWVKLSDMVQDFLESKDSRERLKVFVNTSLGETWEEEGDKVDDNILYTRRENFIAEVPKDGLVITTGVDVQDDRLEVEFVAWGKGEESWSIDFNIIHGDLHGEQIWKDLDSALDKYFTHESGIKIKSSCTCIDSGGHFTEQVYRFCKGREIKRIFATKGSNIAGRPLISRPSINNKHRVKLFMIGTDTAKQTLYARLKMTDPGAGYMHFPLKYDEEYFKQMTAEKATTKYSYGFPTRVWVKTRARNEVLDCRVGAMAALAILNPNFEKIAKSYENIKSETGEKKDDEIEKQKKLMLRKKGWVNNWKP